MTNAFIRRIERPARPDSGTGLDTAASERSVEAVVMAIDVFGNVAVALAWLGRPNKALGGRTPLSLLDTEDGARDVEAILVRIDYGMVE